jgi:alkylated DNA nucleotide flippase Atl1
MQSALPSIAAAHTMPWFRVYDAAGNVIETHEHAGDFKES